MDITNEMRVLKDFLKGSTTLNANLDFGEDYGVENADTIIVTNEYSDIVAEGETADSIIAQLRHKNYITYELCPYCETEVELLAEMRMHICPNCGKHILPCSICDPDNTKCNLCKLERQAHKLNNNI